MHVNKMYMNSLKLHMHAFKLHLHNSEQLHSMHYVAYTDKTNV